VPPTLTPYSGLLGESPYSSSNLLYSLLLLLLILYSGILKYSFIFENDFISECFSHSIILNGIKYYKPIVDHSEQRIKSLKIYKDGLN
jgi:hypothetical protein